MEPPTRTDVSIYSIAATEAAIEMHNSKAYNMLVLGGLIQAVPMVKVDNVLKGLHKTLPERHHHLIPMNEEALRKGMQILEKK